MKKKRKNNKLYRAITHIKLHFANSGKLEKLNQLSEVYMALVQAYVNYIFDHQLKKVTKFDDFPDMESGLSERYKRCAWQQAVGIMQSFFSNGRHNKPELKEISIQGNANVIRLEVSKTSSFDFWLVIATLEKGKPIRVPVKMHGYGYKILETGKLCSGVKLEYKKGQWFAAFVVETMNKKPETSEIIGVDLGIKNLITTETQHFGQFSSELKDKIQQNDLKRRRKQKLNACLEKKGLEPVSLCNEKLNGFINNEIGRAINLFIKSISGETTVVLERLSVSGMKFKSRAMNRVLKASRIGYALDRLKEKLDLKHIRYTTVPAAYTSQQCSCCGYVDKSNRLSQEKFVCKFCGHTDNADVNAGKNIAKRFGDDELNSITNFREVKSLLLKRFFERFPDVCSASGRLELGVTLREIGGSSSTVNQSA